MLATRPAEERALELARSLRGTKILCSTLGRAQAAFQIAAERPDSHVTCWFLDEYQRQLANIETAPPSLSLICQPDLPDQEFDLAVLPFSKSGEAELTRDLLQGVASRLVIGGKLVTATDNPKDNWLGGQLATWFKKVTRHAFKDSAAYVATKQQPLKKLKNFRAEFVFRDGERLIKAVSRPGVFSHRHIDPGARRLLEAAVTHPGIKVLDIGCGAGTVALALAAREPTAQVLAVDSNARAVECTQAGATLNDLTNVTALLNASGDYGEPGVFDLAVTNPPYYADYGIATRFIAAARRSLKPGGRLLIVTKTPSWYEEHMAEDWQEVRVTESKKFWVVSAFR